MVLFLASWLVLAVVAGVLIGKGIHRADVMELRRTHGGGPDHERAQPAAPRVTASASPSGPVPHTHARVA